MSKYGLPSIFISGISAFILAFGIAYYWASRPEVRPDATQQVASSEESEPLSEEASLRSDTPELTAENWEAFLEYEGPRVNMLGIRRHYGSVNFRRSPNVESPVVANPEGGQLLFALDRLNDWMRARLPDGTIGWIHRSLLRELRVPESVAENMREDMPTLRESTLRLIPQEFSNHNRLRVTSDRVNLRRGPGTQFQRAGRVYLYEQLRLLAKRDEWARVQTPGGQIAWIYVPLTEIIYIYPENKRVEKIGKTPDLHYAPQFQFRQMQLSGDSIALRVIAEQEDWVQLELENGYIGWLPADELTQVLSGHSE